MWSILNQKKNCEKNYNFAWLMQHCWKENSLQTYSVDFLESCQVNLKCRHFLLFNWRCRFKLVVNTTLTLILLFMVKTVKLFVITCRLAYLTERMDWIWCRTIPSGLTCNSNRKHFDFWPLKVLIEKSLFCIWWRFVSVYRYVHIINIKMCKLDLLK